MKRSPRGIFFRQFHTLAVHLHLNFNMDFSADMWGAGFTKNGPVCYLNEKSANSKLIRLLHDLG